MKKLLNVYKPKGQTPLEVINLLKEKFTKYKEIKIGYAGRLDPLAHGVLLLMIGEETTKEKDNYLNLSKEYEFEAVFGISTDTYDVLGILKNSFLPEPVEDKTLRLANARSEKKIQSFLKSKLGKHTQPYPPFSSKTVDGKPLFWWAKNNKLSEIEIPKREIEIYDFELISINQIGAAKLKDEIMKQIDSVQGDFRQKEIKEKWNIFFTMNHELKTNNQFLTARFKISCSSGTYIRSLVNELGEKLNCGAITLEILRTKVGEYEVKKSLILQT